MDGPATLSEPCPLPAPTGQGMPPAKRARWDEEGVLDVQAWLREHPPAACGDVQASQPVQLGAGWTKLSRTAGGSAAERYRFGSTEGGCGVGAGKVGAG